MNSSLYIQRQNGTNGRREEGIQIVPTGGPLVREVDWDIPNRGTACEKSGLRYSQKGTACERSRLRYSQQGEPLMRRIVSGRTTQNLKTLLYAKKVQFDHFHLITGEGTYLGFGHIQ